MRSLFPPVCFERDVSEICVQCNRIMSGSLPNSPDGNEDYVVQQENELEALASIFGDDFKDIRTEHPWKVQLSSLVMT